MTTLCIVDMQTEFKRPAKKCLEEVCRQIKLAKRRNAGIVILEYSDCGPTLPEIKRLLKPYKKKTYKQKNPRWWWCRSNCCCKEKRVSNK